MVAANLIGKNMMSLSMGTAKSGGTAQTGGGMQIRGLSNSSSDWTGWQQKAAQSAAQPKADPLDPAEWQWGQSKANKQAAVRPQQPNAAASSNGWPPWALSQSQSPSTKPLSSSEINDFLS